MKAWLQKDWVGSGARSMSVSAWVCLSPWQPILLIYERAALACAGMRVCLHVATAWVLMNAIASPPIKQLTNHRYGQMLDKI